MKKELIAKCDFIRTTNAAKGLGWKELVRCWYPEIAEEYIKSLETKPTMNKTYFFNYHANAGGKTLTCYIGTKLENLSLKQYNKLENGILLELPNGTKYMLKKDK
jgi:hypothetical protein